MKRVLSALCTLAVAAAFGAGPVRANDEPDQGMPGKILIVKAGKLAKFISKPATGTTFALPSAANDPTLEGASLVFTELGGTASISTNLPAVGWKGLGNPAGSKGYKYKGAGSTTDPCKTVLVKEKIVKGICKGSAIDLDQPVSGVVAISLVVGTDSKAYCTAFGGTEIKNDPVLLKRKDSTIGGVCTCGGGNPGTFTFRNTPPTAVNCGTTTSNAGATNNLACNGLYIGSGSGSLSLPAINPDSNKALVMDVGCCTGETLILNPTTQADTTGQQQLPPWARRSPPPSTTPAPVPPPASGQSDRSPSQVGSKGNGNNANNDLSDADLQYANEVAVGHLMEVRLAEMAQHQAHDADVKQVANRLHEDFSKWIDRWSKLAGKDPHMGKLHQQKIERLQKAKDKQFDATYLDIVVENLNSMIPYFQKEGRDAKSGQVRQLVNQELPTLQQNLQVAERLQTDKGKDLSLSKSNEK